MTGREPTMDDVGAYDAKTHFAELLDRVATGEKITITRYGVPVAVLSPPHKTQRPDMADVLRELRTIVPQPAATIDEILEWTKAGRK